MDDLKIAIGSDHAGYEYKEKIIDYLNARNIPYTDVGTHTKESCDYPEIARSVDCCQQSSRDKSGFVWRYLFCKSLKSTQQRKCSLPWGTSYRRTLSPRYC